MPSLSIGLAQWLFYGLPGGGRVATLAVKSHCIESTQKILSNEQIQMLSLKDDRPAGEELGEEFCH